MIQGKVEKQNVDSECNGNNETHSRWNIQVTGLTKLINT